MIKLFTDEEFQSANSDTILPLQCERCGTKFYKSKKRIKDCLNPNHKSTGSFCSSKCSNQQPDKIIQTLCIHCNKPIQKHLYTIIKYKNSFCSQSCAAIYNNTHKSYGYRRSKLEKWIEEQLAQLYPTLEIHFNRKDTINSELDIYIPSLKLAFELNGIFHYEPIFSQEKLGQIQNNDNRKFAACQEAGISLCIIDTSQQKYFKPSTSQKFLDVICKIINSACIGLEPIYPTVTG